MNQCILIGKIVDVSVKSSDRIDVKIAVENEDVQIFAVQCMSGLAKAEYYHAGDIVAVKAHLLMSDEVHIVAEKIAAMGCK